MATYANPKALKLIILFSNSIIFLINSIILIVIIIQLIGIGSPEVITDTSYIPGSSDVDPIMQNSTLPLQDIRLVPTPVLRDENSRRGNPDLIIQRFPSIGSVSVKFLLILSTIGVAILGSVAANSESPKLLNTNGYLCFLSFFVKYLFVIASLHMVGLSNSLHKLGFWLVFQLTTVGVYELVLGLSSCQFASTLKRGDAAEPQIQKLEFLKD